MRKAVNERLCSQLTLLKALLCGQIRPLALQHKQTLDKVKPHLSFARTLTFLYLQSIVELAAGMRPATCMGSVGQPLVGGVAVCHQGATVISEQVIYHFS